MTAELSLLPCMESTPGILTTPFPTLSGTHQNMLEAFQRQFPETIAGANSSDSVQYLLVFLTPEGRAPPVEFSHNERLYMFLRVFCRVGFHQVQFQLFPFTRCDVEDDLSLCKG
jgi:hypothetical protein